MNNNTKSTFKLIMVLVVIALIGFTVATYFFGNRILFFVELAVTVIAVAALIGLLINFNKETRLILKNILSDMEVEKKANITNFPFPVMFLSNDGQMLWYNDTFKNDVIGDRAFNEKIFSSVWQSEKKQKFFSALGLNLTYGEKMYTVYGIQSENSVGTTMFLIDNTYYKTLERKYLDTKSCVMQIVIDNYEEVFSRTKESDKVRILGQIETLFEDFVSTNKAFFRKLQHDRYILIVEQKYMEKLVEERFALLKEIKKIKAINQTSVTLSIGIGKDGKDILESDKFSHQALDMALGRGGDQVAVKMPDNKYEFYGGVSSGVESSSKVKTRIMASALSKIIHESDSVITMGHRMSDMDSFGSAVAMATAIRRMGKNAYLAIDKNKNQVSEILGKMEQNGYTDLFLDPSKALEKMGRNSLVIITDTHIAHMLESQEVYDRASNVVVIDHHRRMVGYIENSVLFFHEPNASSTSEMLAELIPYLDNAGAPSPLEAEAMLAGITLDTRNFTFKTGVRTFEAAAYLKRHGADTVAVKRLFSTSEETYNKKVKVVSNAKLHGKNAIATTDLEGEDMSLVAPQAADELLTITDVMASFVLYKTSVGKVQISARSYGEVNVQIIMEALDGGGHLTMAGATLDATLEEAEKRLIEAIDNYYNLDIKDKVLEEGFVDEKEEEKDIQEKLENLSDILSDG